MIRTEFNDFKEQFKLGAVDFDTAHSLFTCRKSYEAENTPRLIDIMQSITSFNPVHKIYDYLNDEQISTMIKILAKTIETKQLSIICPVCPDYVFNNGVIVGMNDGVGKSFTTTNRAIVGLTKVFKEFEIKVHANYHVADLEKYNPRYLELTSLTVDDFADKLDQTMRGIQETDEDIDVSLQSDAMTSAGVDLENEMNRCLQISQKEKRLVSRISQKYATPDPNKTLSVVTAYKCYGDYCVRYNSESIVSNTGANLATLEAYQLCNPPPAILHFK